MNIDSLDWIKNKEATINPINNVVTVALNHGEIKIDSQRLTKVKPLLNKYNWEGINLPSEKDDWKKTEKNNVTIALVLYAKKEKYILLIFEDMTQIIKNKLFF